MNDSTGRRLLVAREARNLSLEDVSRAIKIRKVFITALETDDYGQFPSITHARNFLLIYGKYLKVDVKDGTNLLATPDRIGIENYQYLNVERDDQSNVRNSRRSRTSPQGNGQGRKIFVIIGIVIALIFAIGYLSINLPRLFSKTSEEKSSEETASQIRETPTPIEPVLQPSLGRPDPTPSPSSSPFHTRSSNNRQLWEPQRTPLP